MRCWWPRLTDTQGALTSSSKSICAPTWTPYDAGHCGVRVRRSRCDFASMMKTARLQYILTYLTDPDAKLASVRAVNAAIAAGAMDVGEHAGLPLRRYPVERTADAHRASEVGVIGPARVHRRRISRLRDHPPPSRLADTATRRHRHRRAAALPPARGHGLGS